MSERAYYAESRLRALVAELGGGDRIPSERELATQWRVARETVRSAISRLAEERRLVSRHGAGTFVAVEPVVRALGLTSFTEDLAAQGRVASTRTVSFAHERADAVTAADLEIAVGDEVVAFTRVRYADGQAIGVERSWILAAGVPGLTSADVDGSLYDVLRSRYDLAPRRASSVITGGGASEADAQLLGLRVGEPCLRMRLVDRGEDGVVFMLAECVYDPQRYELRAELIHPERAS